MVSVLFVQHIDQRVIFVQHIDQRVPVIFVQDINQRVIFVQTHWSKSNLCSIIDRRVIFILFTQSLFNTFINRYRYLIFVQESTHWSKGNLVQDNDQRVYSLFKTLIIEKFFSRHWWKGNRCAKYYRLIVEHGRRSD